MSGLGLGDYENNDIPVSQGRVTINVVPDYDGLKTQKNSLTETSSSSSSSSSSINNGNGDFMGIKSPFNRVTRDMNPLKVFSIDFHDPLFAFKKDLGPQSSKTHVTHVEKVPLVRSTLNGLKMPKDIARAINSLNKKVSKSFVMEWIRSCLEFVGMALGTYTYDSDEGNNSISVRPIACIIAGVVSVRAHESLPVGTLIRFMPPRKDQYEKSNWINTTDDRNVRGKLMLYAEPVNRYTVRSRILGALNNYMINDDDIITALQYMGRYADSVIPHVALPQSMKVFALSCVSAFLGSGGASTLKILNTFTSINTPWQTVGDKEGVLDNAINQIGNVYLLKKSQNDALIQASLHGLITGTGKSGSGSGNAAWWNTSNYFFNEYRSALKTDDAQNEKYNKLIRAISTQKKNMLKLLFCKESKNRKDVSRFGFGYGIVNNHFPVAKNQYGITIEKSPAGYLSKIMDDTVADVVDSFLLYNKSVMGQVDGKVIKGSSKGGRADVLLTPGKQL